MAKGQIAKSSIGTKLKNLFGENFLGESGGKYYVLEDDGGELVQIAISMTCPKTPFSGSGVTVSTKDEGVDFSSYEPAVITDEERENVNKLLKFLGKS